MSLLTPEQLNGLVPGVSLIPFVVIVVEFIKTLYLAKFPNPSFPVWPWVAGVLTAASYAYFVDFSGMGSVSLAVNILTIVFSVSAVYDKIAKPILERFFPSTEPQE